MKQILIFCAVLILAACQQDSSKEANQDNQAATAENNAKEANSVEKQHNDHAGHDHAEHAHQATETGYIEIEPQDSCDQPTVIEFFAYQCPHCYKLEEPLEKWKETLSEDVRFVSMPTDLGRKEFFPFVVIHHSADELGVLDKIKPQLFATIHENKIAFQDFEGVVKMFVEAGVDEQKARETLQNEQMLRNRLEQDYNLMLKYKITGVPAVLVNYQYQVSVSSAGGYDKVFEVVDKALKLPAKCSQK